MEDVPIGVDIIEIDRVEKTLRRFGSRFLERIYTAEEIAYCRGRPAQLAARFAAKEAVMKALGTGTRGVGWKDVEISRERTGKPRVNLKGRAAARALALGIHNMGLSISHSRTLAVASVVANYR